jgi:hypothetical protein
VGSVDGRNVLEWRLDPTSPDSIKEARQPGFTPIIVSRSSLHSSISSLVYLPLSVRYLFILLLDRTTAKNLDVQ